MRQFVREILKIYFKDEGMQQSIEKIYRMRQDPGWAEFVKIIHIVRGFMAQEMLGKKYTELNAVEKDVTQRTYAGINEFLDFLEHMDRKIKDAYYLHNQDKVVAAIIEQQKREGVAAIL